MFVGPVILNYYKNYESIRIIYVICNLGRGVVGPVVIKHYKKWFTRCVCVGGGVGDLFAWMYQ